MSSEEPNPFDEDVLAELRNQARAGAPAVTRVRVAARLTAAGVGALTGAASAPAAASLGTTTATSTLTSLALTKTFAIGLALGVGSAVAAHSVNHVRTVDVAQSSKPATLTSNPALALTTTGSVSREGTRSADFAREAAANPVAPINPAPELPRAERSGRNAEATVSPARSEHRLAQQQELLDSARKRLRSGEPGRALEIVELHRARFPRTTFEEERQALAIRALRALGRDAEANERTREFGRRFAGSLFLPALRKTDTSTAARETVTEPSAPPQTTGEGSALR